MTEVGTCPICGRRFACTPRTIARPEVVVRHNNAPHICCPGSGTPPVEGSITFQPSGRRIEQPHGRLEPSERRDAPIIDDDA